MFMITKCHEYVSQLFSCIMIAGSNIGLAAARSAGPVSTPLRYRMRSVFYYWMLQCITMAWLTGEGRGGSSCFAPYLSTDGMGFEL